jgi:hypothetical protein
LLALCLLLLLSRLPACVPIAYLCLSLDAKSAPDCRATVQAVPLLLSSSTAACLAGASVYANPRIAAVAVLLIYFVNVPLLAAAAVAAAARSTLQELAYLPVPRLLPLLKC